MSSSLSLLLLLAVPLVVFSQTTKAPPPAFLNGLSNDAKREFGQIAGNRGLSRGDIRTQVYTWADKNGVKSQVEEYLNKKNQAKAANRAKIEAAIAQLPEAYKTLNTIGDDDSLTQPQADEKIKNLMLSYSWELKELLRLAGPANQGRKPGAAPGA